MKRKLNLPIPPRILVTIEVVVFLVASATAVYLWTAPQREEARLSRASFEQLLKQTKKETENPRVFYHLGLRLRQLGHDGPARTAFERAATLDPDNEDIWLAWAATCARVTGDKEAFGILTMYTGAHPGSVRAHLALALLYQQQEAYQRAWESSQKVIALDARNVAAWRLSSSSARELRKLVEATEAAQKAVELENNNWQNHQLLGEALEAQHKYPQARTAFEKAVALAPEEPRPLASLGVLRLQTATHDGDVTLALESLEKAAKLRPEWYQPHLETGRGYTRLKQWKKAEEALRRAERLAPNSPEVAFALKEWAIGVGDTVQAERYGKQHQEQMAARMERLRLHSLVWQKPDDAKRRLEYARFLIQNKDYPEAVRQFQKLLEQNPKPPVENEARFALNLLEKTYPDLFRPASLALPMPAVAQSNEQPTSKLLADGQGMRKRERFAEAQKVYESVLIRDPASAEALEGLGICLYQLGKVDEAAIVLQKAVQNDTKRHEAAYTLAHIYFDTGFADEAARRMEKIVAIKPDVAEYWHALGLACVTVGSPERMEQARKAYQQATTWDTTNYSYLRDLANVEKELRDFASAETHYRTALQKNPDDPVSLQLLGILLVENNPTSARLKEAEMLLVRADKALPQNPVILSSLGDLWLRQGNAKKAVNYLEVALERNPGDTQAWYKLHRAYEKLRNRERSQYCLKAFRTLTEFKSRLSLAEESARMNLKDPQRRLTLARLYAESGQNAKAINQYQMVLKLDAKNVIAKKEMEAFVAQLKARGEMPAMQAFEGMMIASIAEREREKSKPELSPSPAQKTQ